MAITIVLNVAFALLFVGLWAGAVRRVYRFAGRTSGASAYGR
jgi:hypothetical protein